MIPEPELKGMMIVKMKRKIIIEEEKTLTSSLDIRFVENYCLQNLSGRSRLVHGRRRDIFSWTVRNKAIRSYFILLGTSSF